MSKKALNTDAITNELEGASLFFTTPIKSSDPVSGQPISTQPPIHPPENTPVVLKAVETNPVQFAKPQKTSTEKANERSIEPTVERGNEQTYEITNVRSNNITNERPKEPGNERSNGQPNKRQDERKTERLRKRQNTRHTFDIYADQLLSLKEIALSREKLTAEKVLLGDLAKEAMDLLITKENFK